MKTIRHIGLVMVLALSLVLLLAAPAAAHTGFGSSSPADGDTVSEPVAEISLTFTGEAAPAGDGFVVLDPEGVVRVPDEVVSSDDLTWTLRFVEPLTNGVVGVRWKVAAQDAHPIEGSFSFTIDAPAPAVVATTSVPITAVPATAAPVALADFLDTGKASATGVDRVGDIGSALGLVGFVLAFGGIAFAALALRGDESDIRAVLLWVRRAGVVAMMGVVIAALAHVAKLASGWSGLWSSSALGDALLSSFGLAVLLRFAGGALVTGGVKLAVHSADTARDPLGSVKLRTVLHDGDSAWHIEKSPAAFVGAALLALSYLFDGHTVSEGPRWLHAIANAVHVTTAATWAGGVIMLLLVIARRQKRGADSRALQLAVRFSVVATIALVGAALAGIVLALVIIDSVSDIWLTPWGQLLIVKVILVGIAAAGGGYNHRIVIPTLEHSPEDGAVAHKFRRIVTLEAVALVAVTLVTALLIAASAA